MGKYRRKKTVEEIQDDLMDAVLKRRVSYRIADHIMKGLAVGFITAAVLTSPFGLYVILKGSLNYVFRKEDFDRELQRFEKKGFVAVTKTESRYKIRVFKKARERQIKARMKLLQLPVEDKWDGNFRFVVFDIPEETRGKRDGLRKKLKDLGMFNIQRSVLVYPYECRDEVDVITEFFGVKKYTTYAVVSSCDIDKELRKHFKL